MTQLSEPSHAQCQFLLSRGGHSGRQYLGSKRTGTRKTAMNENRTASILLRLPIILAVTAASYGLSFAQAGPPRAATPAPIAVTA